MMTGTTSEFFEPCALVSKAEDTFTGLPDDCALSCSLTMMPPLSETTNDKQASHVTVRERLILARLVASETMMPYNQPSASALLGNRGRGFAFLFFIYIPFLWSSVTSRAPRNALMQHPLGSPAAIFRKELRPV